MNGQAELFAAPDTSQWQRFQSSAGGELRYRSAENNLILVEFDGEVIPVTKQSQDRYFTRIDGKEKRARGLRNFLELLIAVQEARHAIAARKQAQEMEDRAVGRVLDIAETRPDERQGIKPRSRNKLAKARQPGSQEKRYINPFKDRSTLFNRVPAWLESRSEPSPLEKLLYGRLTFPSKIRKDGTGEAIRGFCDGWDESTGAVFGINLTLLAKTLGAGTTATRTAFNSLDNRNLIEIGNKGHGLTKTVRFLRHAWQDASSTLTVELGGNMDRQSASTSSTLNDESLPLRSELSVDLKKERSKERVIVNNRAQDERELLEQIRAIAGENEVRNSGGNWRLRIRNCRRAVLNAIEDWKMRTPDQRQQIRNVGAWLADRHARALVEIDRAKNQKAG